MIGGFWDYLLESIGGIFFIIGIGLWVAAINRTIEKIKWLKWPALAMAVAGLILITTGIVMKYPKSLKGEKVAIASPAPRPVAASVFVKIAKPQSDDSLEVELYPDGIHRGAVLGSFSGLSNEQHIFLWIRPVKPRSETFGWYLQRPPGNGVNHLNADGTWEGIAQIGNRDFPPQAGDLIDIGVTMVNSKTADDLLSQRGMVTRDQPLGIVSDIVRNIKVKTVD